MERMEGKRLPNAALHGHVEGKKSRGRQSKTWMDKVREDLKEKNIDLTRIGEVTRNREVWRSLVRASSSACLWRSEKKKNIAVMQHIIVIVNSKLLKRHSKAKHRAPAYSRALRQIRGVFQRIVRGRLRSVFQRVRECVKSEVLRR